MQARVLIDYSWELYVAQRWDDAVQAGRRALTLCEALGDRGGRGRAPWSCSPAAISCPVDRSRRCEEVERAVAVLEPTGDVAALAHAETYLGAVQALTDRQDEALPRLRAAHGAGPTSRAPRPGGAVQQLHRLCARRSRRRRGRARGPAPKPAPSARAAAPRVRRPRLHQSRGDGLPAAPLRRARVLDRRRRAVRGRPRPARAPLQPGGAPRAAAAQPGTVGRGRDATAAAGRGRPRAGTADPADAAAARPAAGSTRRRRRRRAARPGLGPRRAATGAWPRSRRPGWR